MRKTFITTASVFGANLKKILKKSFNQIFHIITKREKKMLNRGSRYIYFIDREEATKKIQRAINECTELLFQETEVVVSHAEVETSMENTISFPPHYFRLLKVVKELNEIIKSIDRDQFLSLEPPK